MSTNHNLPKSKFLIAAALAGVMLAACSPKPESASEVAAEQLVQATQKAEEAAARAEAAQKALETAEAEKAAAEAKAAADSEQAAADAKLKTAQDRAAAAEREAAAAKKRAAAAERQSASASSYTEARPAAPAPVCQDCGTISTITAVKVKGKGTGMGAVAGAIAGIAAGNQVGDGKGTDVAKVVGAIGGAYAGNQAEKHIRGETVYDVSVRMDNGTTRTVRVADATSVSSGTRVRVSGANLERL